MLPGRFIILVQCFIVPYLGIQSGRQSACFAPVAVSPFAKMESTQFYPVIALGRLAGGVASGLVDVLV